MPAIAEAVKKLFDKEPNKSINPDEVVALGAAIQGGILQGEVKDVLLLDVTPLSLGIETLGGVMTKIIEKNTTIPVSRSQIFSTAQDNQPSVEIHVLQGEREMANDNKTLGRFILDGIPPAPRGVPQIEVSFDIDANGILNVKAKDKATGKEQSIRIEASSGLSKEEIERMKKEAEMHLEADKKKKALAEAKNIADNLIYTAEKAIKESAGKVSDDLKKSIQEKIDALKKIKDSSTEESEIKQKTEELSREMQKIGTNLYRQQQGGGGESENKKQYGSKSDDTKADEAEEAEYEEIKDDEENKK
jgi:molecular chaperone DnaK